MEEIERDDELVTEVGDNGEESSPIMRSLYRIVIIIGCIWIGSTWIQKNSLEKEFLSTMYSYAVDEVRGKLTNASNVKIAKFTKKNVVWQTYEYCDFGFGELRYAKYAVKVPTEWDATLGHMEKDITIIVYYYTSDQNVSDGVDESVQNHFYVVDMYNGLYNMFE